MRKPYQTSMANEWAQWQEMDIMKPVCMILQNCWNTDSVCKNPSNE